MPGQPLHARIRADLEGRIRSGEWPPGTVLPTEAQLREQWQVSRATAQHALRDLAQAGLVTRRRRTGTVVSQTAAEENLLRFTNVLTEGPELHGDHRVLEAGVVPAADTGVDLPGVPADAAVIRMHRIKEDDGQRPVGEELAVVPFEIAPRMLDEPLATLTTLAYFRRTRVPAARARLYVEPVTATDEQARLLGCEVGSALFRLRRETYLADGRIAEVLIELLLPDSIHLYVEQSLPPVQNSQREEGT